MFRFLAELPQVMAPAFVSRSFSSREISSETRMPVAYKSSSIALSLCPIAEVQSGAAKRRSTSASVSTLGRS